MISLEAVIRQFGLQALHLQLKEAEADTVALLILHNIDAPNRGEALRNWFQTYQVYQGIVGQQRVAIASAVLQWADHRDPRRNLTTVDALVAAHAELMEVCTEANGAQRDFTSLASKALWLCYPDSVPIFDSFTQRALWVTSKLEGDIAPLPEGEPQYRKFVHIWKALYHRYETTLNEIDMGTYPFRVRIFDKILWLIGEPRYGCREG